MPFVGMHEERRMCPPRELSEGESRNIEFLTLNPDMVSHGDNGCEHRLVRKTVRMAYGFNI